MFTRLLSHVRPVDRIGPRTGPNGTVIKTPADKQIAKGHGNWACWDADETPALLAAAECWASQLPPGDKYWICWSNDDAWCRVQQRLVLEVGWTPLVAADVSLGGEPTVLPGAVRLDFAAGLPLRDVWMHFPLEMAFAWVERLAFWHSDVLLPRPLMQAYARQFDDLSGPVTAAVFSRRDLLRPRGWNNADRWFEVIGCTTRAASRDQWARGAGWWKHFQNHPNCQVVPDLHRYNWDHGGGIRYWQRQHGGQVCRLQFDSRHHVSHYHRPDLRPAGQPLTGVNLPSFASSLGIGDLIGE
jgi:hypothetical protein